jgi:hypothetical protein
LHLHPQLTLTQLALGALLALVVIPMAVLAVLESS